MKPAEKAGHVYLVGAGPGDPGLLTARALELIAVADTILYDRLIPPQALEGALPDAELLFVGKQGGGESVPQEQTEALMVERALAGRTVVRLKGGDPFVFGRGGEEALALRKARIDFEVVPGVTAGVAATAYAGIPVTHRGISTGVALVTGHTQEGTPHEGGQAGEDPAKPEQELDWDALAAFPGTLVFYMGVRALSRISDSLIAAGRPPSQPVALVERGTLPDQRTVKGTLATIAQVASLEKIKAPAITVVGEVVSLGQSLAWRDTRPLTGLSNQGGVPSKYLIGLPLLMELPGVAWLAITEADLKGYSSMYLENLPGQGHALLSRLACASCTTPLSRRSTLRPMTSCALRAPTESGSCSSAWRPPASTQGPWREPESWRSDRAPSAPWPNTESWPTSCPSVRSPSL